MAGFKFSTDKFGLSDASIHFLRDRYNYKTVDFLHIDHIVISRGAQINNWFIAFILGAALILVPAYVLFLSITSQQIHLTGLSVELVILPIFFGVYALYHALTRDYVLRITHDGRCSTFPLRQIRKKNELDALKNFLATNMLTKNKLTVVY